jgi:FdhD protein
MSIRLAAPDTGETVFAPGTKPVPIRQWKAGCWEDLPGGVIVEQPVSLSINGEEWLTFLCTPVDLEALAVGFLFNENFIQDRDEIASIRVCPSGENIDVWTSHAVVRPKVWRRTTGCTGGMTADHNAVTQPIALCEVNLPAEQIGELAQQLFACQDLYRQVGGVHTSALSDGQNVLVSAEDIGRHNTLDKIAGKCLLERITPAQRVLLTTGRISSEMLQKAARIKASIIISRTSPSSLSVELAQALGITLIGYAHRDRFGVYAHPERIS